MKLKRISIATSILTLSLLLSSCASYKASPLCSLASEQFFITNDPLLVVSKTFSSQDCDRYLDRDVISEGYQPVQLYFQNDTDKSYLFSLTRIGLPIARPEEVAEKVHTSTVGRAVGYGAGSLFFWPLAIPAIVDGIGSSKANKALDSDFFAKAAKDQIIFPHSRHNTIIFVPTYAYQDTYTLTLIEQESNNPKTFNLTSIR